MPAPVPPEQRREITAARDSGVSVKTVAERFGVSESAVRAIHRESTGKPPRRYRRERSTPREAKGRRQLFGIPAEERLALARAYSEGAPVPEIQARHNISAHTLGAILDDTGTPRRETGRKPGGMFIGPDLVALLAPHVRPGEYPLTALRRILTELGDPPPTP